MTSNNFFYIITTCLTGFTLLALTIVLTEQLAITFTIIASISFFVGSLYFILKDYDEEYAKIS